MDGEETHAAGLPRRAPDPPPEERAAGAEVPEEEPPDPQQDPAPEDEVARREWLLTDAERDNPACALAPWTVGNEAVPLPHGGPYFAALLRALERTVAGDLVLLSGWRGDDDQLFHDDGPTVGDVLSAAARRGVTVVGLVWRSHLELVNFTAQRNIALAETVNAAGGQILLDQRVKPMGSHHQKFVVVRYRDDATEDVAFVGGIDLGHGRRDDARHLGDPQTRGFNPAYGPRPAWHDVQVLLRGPAVRSVELTFRERWQDPSMLSRLPWHVLSDRLRPRLNRHARELPDVRDAPDGAGTAAVQLLRTYPRRRPASPFAPRGERSVARGYGKALRRARRLVYLEDQYVWSEEAARVFCRALEDHPDLRLVLVVPRLPDSTGLLASAATVGHSRAVDMLREAGGGRVAAFDPENHDGTPVYVHAKVCVVDDVWATIGSDNVNRRSWTHDSELTAAVLDAALDTREPTDPAGLGDGARRFARDLRLQLMREHLDLEPGEDDALLDPVSAFETVVASAERLEQWYRGGQVGPRPPGRLRPHVLPPLRKRGRALAALGYGLLLDPDGRPRSMRRRHEF